MRCIFYVYFMLIRRGTENCCKIFIKFQLKPKINLLYNCMKMKN